MADEVEKWVLVGKKTLSAPMVKPDEPIRFGEVLALSPGRALDYVKDKTYTGPNRMELPMFYPLDSHEARVAIARATGTAIPQAEEQPQVRGRARRSGISGRTQGA